MTLDEKEALSKWITVPHISWAMAIILLKAEGLGPWFIYQIMVQNLDSRLWTTGIWKTYGNTICFLYIIFYILDRPLKTKFFINFFHNAVSSIWIHVQLMLTINWIEFDCDNEFLSHTEILENLHWWYFEIKLKIFSIERRKRNRLSLIGWKFQI